MHRVKDIFTEFGNSMLEVLPNILAGVIVLGTFVLIGYVLGRVINNRMQRKWTDTVVAHFIGRIVKWIFVLLGIIIALHFVGFGGIATSILAGAGVSALIIGFALKDIAENFLAGVLLAVNRPFKLGDIIECAQYKGPVRKLDLRSTHIRTVDGRDIYIPNAMIIKSVFINYTKDGLLRQEFTLGLDTYDDLERARLLIVDYFSEQPDVLNEPKPNLIVDKIGESSIEVKVLFWVDILKKKAGKDLGDTGEAIRSRVMREVKELLLANGFNLPSVIMEHKMYREDAPLKLNLIDDRK